MAYSDKVIDHYENPRNVGGFDKGDESVGTGMVGAPACGDVMKLQIKVNPATGKIKWQTPYGDLPQAGPSDKLRGNVFPKSGIVVTAGGNMAFMNAVLAICDSGDEVILPAPYYFNHEMAIVMANCRPVLVPTD